MYEITVYLWLSILEAMLDYLSETVKSWTTIVRALMTKKAYIDWNIF